MSDEEKAYREFFAEADLDKDGFITLDELTVILKHKGYGGGDAKIKAMFNAVDLSGDNKISLEEYLASMGQVPAKDHKEALMRTCFRGFDKNGDGKIDRSELDAVFKELGRYVSPAEIDRMIKLADKDQSGTIDYEEFVKEIFGLE